MLRPTTLGSARIALHGLVACCVLATLACAPPGGGEARDEGQHAGSGAAPEAASVFAVSAVERGEYLVAAGACIDCHTPLRMGPDGPEPDMTRYMAGHPEDQVVDPPPEPTEHSSFWMWSQSNTVFMGPFGTSYAINLTPDEATGIGAWTEDIFVETLKTGRHWGVSRPILPPMPWQSYSKLTDDDLRAMFTYLRSIPPLANRVPEAQPAPLPAPPAG